MKKVWEFVKNLWPVAKAYICMNRNEAQELVDFFDKPTDYNNFTPQEPSIVTKAREVLKNE